MADDPLDAIISSWIERRDRGLSLSPEDVIEEHPERASELRLRFGALEVLDWALGATAGVAAPIRERLGDFRLIREIGRGGMGIVYEAEQVPMRRRVALKVLHPAVLLEPRAVERFRREARAAGRVHHTNIVPVYGLGEEAGVWFYAMELVEGRSLAQVLADLRRLAGSPAPRSPSSLFGTTVGTQAFHEHVAGLFAGVAEALDAAHAAGAVHRDVKPGNLMLDAGGTLKLTDFGLARVRHEGPSMTISGALLGTPAYMSPEQADSRGEEPDGRTDVYSLGATLYETLTLRPPFEGGSVPEVIRQLTTVDPPRPREINTRIPKDLETIVLKAMERDPTRRYATAGDLAHDLRAFACHGPLLARRVGWAGRTWRVVKRRRWRVAAAAGLLVAGVVASVAWSRAAGERRLREARGYTDAIAAFDVARVQHHLLAVPLEHGAPGADAEAFLARAVALAPDRFEAYARRARFPGRSPTERLADLEEARRRGMPARAYHAAHAALAGLLAQGEVAEEAWTLAQAAPDGDDPSGETALLMAEVLQQRGELEAAERTLTAALSGASRHVGSRYRALAMRARGRELRGDVAGAIEDLSAIGNEPSDASILLRLRLAATWRTLGLADRASQVFSETLARARERGSEDLWSRFLLICEADGHAPWTAEATRAAREAFPASSRVLAAAPKAAGGHAAAHGHANDLLRERSFGAAIREYARAIELDPFCAWAHQDKSKALRGIGLMEEALREARLSELLDPIGEPKLATGRIDMLLAIGRREEAAESAAYAVRRWPTVSAVRVTAAQVAIAGKRYAEAARLLKEATGLDADNAVAWAIAADLSRMTGKVSEGLAQIEEALGRMPTHPSCLLVKAKLLEAGGKGPEATALLEKAIALPAAREDRAFLLGAIALLQALGQAQRGIAVLESIGGTAETEDTTFLEYRLDLLEVLERPEEALACATRLTSLLPRDAAAHHRRAQLLSFLGQRGPAADAAEEALALDPAWSDRERALADVDIVFTAGRAQRALELLAAGTASGGDATDAERAMRLKLLVHLGRLDHALIAAVEERARQPGDTFFRTMEITILRWQGRAEDARKAARKSLEVFGASLGPVPKAHYPALAGDLDEARRLLEAQADAPVDEDTYVRACTWALLGEAERAIGLLESAAEAGFVVETGAPEEPEFAALAQNPRYRAVRARMQGETVR